MARWDCAASYRNRLRSKQARVAHRDELRGFPRVRNPRRNERARTTAHLPEYECKAVSIPRFAILACVVVFACASAAETKRSSTRRKADPEEDATPSPKKKGSTPKPKAKAAADDE